MVRKTSWLLGIAFAGLVLHQQVTAEAHVATGATSTWCSPHGATQSNGGSYFSGCYRLISDSNKFHRDFWCDEDTKCSRALCKGSTTSVACGSSDSDGATSHGKAGGHFPVTNLTSCKAWICGSK